MLTRPELLRLLAAPEQDALHGGENGAVAVKNDDMALKNHWRGPKKPRVALKTFGVTPKISGVAPKIIRVALKIFFPASRPPRPVRPACLVRPVLFSLFTSLFSLAGPARAASSAAVSPAFTFDARYAPSGITPDAWAGTEVSSLSALFSLQTRPIAVDSDSDGLPDVWELYHGTDPNTPDADLDPDNDGRTNLEEYNAGTAPLVPDDWSLSSAASPAFLLDASAPRPEIPDFSIVEVHALSQLFHLATVFRAVDSDSDGLPDAWELAHGTDPNTPDADLDPDNDGRTNLEEYNAGTDPLAPDDWALSAASSPAFLADTRILYAGLPPTISNLFAVVRVASGTFVCDTGGLYYDWDGDGIPNWWCLRYTGEKTGIDPAGDLDNDGVSNLAEFTAYTDPTDPSSYLAIMLEPLPASATRDAAFPTYAVTWPSAPNRVYTLYSADSLLDDANVTPLATLSGTGGTLSVPVPHSAATPIRFFYLSVDLPPRDQGD